MGSGVQVCLPGGHESRSLLSLINESLAPRSHVIHGAEKVRMEESTICLSMIHPSINIQKKIHFRMGLLWRRSFNKILTNNSQCLVDILYNRQTPDTWILPKLRRSYHVLSPSMTMFVASSKCRNISTLGVEKTH